MTFSAENKNKMKKSCTSDFREMHMIELLRQAVTHRNTFKDLSGETCEILRLGPYSRSSGPDFRNCMVKIGNQKLYGDIEVDLHGSDWFRHGHFQNSKYENVILHVVCRGGVNPVRTQTKSGQRIRTIMFPLYSMDCKMVKNPCVDEKLIKSWNRLPCKELVAGKGMEGLRQMLILEGLKRFREKTVSARRDISPDDSLASAYYKLLFLHFGRGLNHPRFQFLLGKLGNRPFTMDQAPELIQNRINALIGDEKIRMVRAGLRPNDSPDKRIEIFIRCLGLDTGRNLVFRIGKIISDAGSGFQERTSRILRILRENGFSSGRARMVLVNVMLPLFFHFEPGCASAAMSLFLLIPAYEKNSRIDLFEDVFRQLTGWTGLKTEVEQQGCLRIYNRYCQSFCRRCPLLRFLRGKDRADG
jgi:hypothetical protein